MKSNEIASSPISDVDRLIATEDIRQLKYRWWAAVDAHKWDEVMALFESPDAKVVLGMKFPDGRPITNAKEFVEFCSSAYYLTKRAKHLGHNPIITITSPTEAEAAWGFEAVEYPVTDGKAGSASMHVWGQHSDDYVKTARGWRIAVTRLGGAVTFTAYAPATR